MNALQKAKHVGIKYHTVRVAVQSILVSVKYTPSSLNQSDDFTKVPIVGEFLKHCAWIGVCFWLLIQLRTCSGTWSGGGVLKAGTKLYSLDIISVICFCLYNLPRPSDSLNLFEMTNLVKAANK